MLIMLKYLAYVKEAWWLVRLAMSSWAACSLNVRDLVAKRLVVRCLAFRQEPWGGTSHLWAAGELGKAQTLQL